MQKSTDYEFVLLGCVASNLATDAYPFVVVVSEIVNGACTLKGYVLKGWQNIREFFPDDVREEVLHFLDSLGGYAVGPEAARYIAHLQTLSVGPIRFLSSGTCSLEDLDRRVAAILDSGQAPVL